MCCVGPSDFRYQRHRILRVMDGQTTPGAGRPRDPSIDERVGAAARALLVEEGWDATTVRGVARRACVSRAAVLRRWPSKAHLVLDAVIGSAPDLTPFSGVDRDGWIRWVVQGSVELFARPEVRAAAPGLLSALRDEPELRDALWHGFTGAPAEIFADATGGRRDEAVLDAKAIIVLAAGAALFAGVLAADEDDAALRARIERMLLGRPAVAGRAERASAQR